MVTDDQTNSGTPGTEVSTSRRRLLQMMGATGLAGIGTTGAVAADDADTTDTEALPIDSRDLEVAVMAAKQAADIHDENADAGVEADTKAPQQLVTEVDTSSETIIRDTIRDELGDDFEADGYALFGEEEGGSLEGDRVWIIDPLDGTTNFARGIPHYCVSIAVTRDSELYAGVIYYSPTDEVYVAVRGEGTYRYLGGEDGMPVSGTTTELTVTSTETVEESLNSVGFYSEAGIDDERYRELMKTFVTDSLGIRQLGAAAVDLAFVAEGVFDTLTVKDLKEVDIAAGALLVEEAGGTVTDFEGNSSLEAILAGDTVATNCELHDELLELYNSAD
ncbi:inositol monophosphatase family protein [Halalkalicoccus paucihalophilus]|nr:inositol monophosphatase family protein [Halalkalicoccus paucihalophilus]